MSNSSKSLMLKSLLALGLMLSAAAGAHYARPTLHMAAIGPKVELETLFPPQFGEWRLDTAMPVILPAPDVQALLSRIYAATLARTYVNAQGQRIMLSVAYGGDQSDGQEAHRPEVCYPAQGFQVSQLHTAGIELGNGRQLPVRRMASQMGGRYEPVTYWIVVGDQIALSNSQQKLAQLRYGVRGMIPDGMLVRVSSISRDQEQAFQLQARFVNDLLAASTAAQRKRIAGALGAS